MFKKMGGFFVKNWETFALFIGRLLKWYAVCLSTIVLVIRKLIVLVDDVDCSKSQPLCISVMRIPEGVRG